MNSRNFVLSIIFAVSIFTYSMTFAQEGSLQFKGGAIDTNRIEKLKMIQERNENRIMKIPGVAGIGIGLAEDGAAMAFIVYVEKLRPDLTANIPKYIENVPVRLIESGVFKAY